MFFISAKDIKVISGEFRVLLPDEILDEPHEEGSRPPATLLVSAKFSVLSHDGSTLAVGIATNGEPVGGIKVELSEVTLSLFQAFYEALEADIKDKLTGLEKGEGDAKTTRGIVDELLGQ